MHRPLGFLSLEGSVLACKGPQRQGLARFQRAQDFRTRCSGAGDTPARILPDLVAAYEEKQLSRGRIPWGEAWPVSLTLPANASRWMQLKLGGPPRPDTDTGCERVGHYAVPMGWYSPPAAAAGGRNDTGVLPASLSHGKGSPAGPPQFRREKARKSDNEGKLHTRVRSIQISM